MGACVRVCDCNFSMANTGTECAPNMQVPKKLLFTPTYDSTGTRNYLNLASPITQSTFTALINQTDSSKRLYPLPVMKNVNDTRETPIVETFSDNSTMFIRDNVRKFEGMIVGRDANPIVNAAIESARCGDVSVYIVDRLGSIIGIISDDGTKLYPIKLDSGSLASLLVKPTDTTSGKLTVTFNYDPDESDNCLRMITSSEMGGADLLPLKGLLDVTAEFSNISQTGVDVKLKTSFGTPLNPVLVKGLVTADFISSDSAATSKVYNVTDTADLTVTVTESTGSPGNYTLAWASQTVADEIVILCTKAGFDFTPMLAQTDNPITIV